MAHTQSVDAIIECSPYSALPKQMGKPEYASIRDTHCLLTTNAELIKSPHRRARKATMG